MGRPKKNYIASMVTIQNTTEPKVVPETPAVEAKPIAPPRPVIKPIAGDFQLKISTAALQKIEYLCDAFPTVEWSGTLYYKVIGDINDENFSVEVVDLFLQDIGTATYTEYEFSEEYAGFMAAHPELRGNDIYEGHIHSHNNMATFFSGTDDGELIDSAVLRKNILSLIVNNAGVYTAALGTLAEAEVKQITSYKYPLFSGEEISFQSDVSKVMPVVFKKMAVIIKEAPEKTLRGMFSSIISGIKARKEVNSKKNYSGFSRNYGVYGGTSFDDSFDEDYPKQPYTPPTIFQPHQYPSNSQESLKKGEAKKKEGVKEYEAQAILLITKAVACAKYFKGTLSEALRTIPISTNVSDYEIEAANSFDDILGYVIETTSTVKTQLTIRIMAEKICSAANDYLSDNSLKYNPYVKVIHKFIQDNMSIDDMPDTTSEAISNLNKQ